MHFRSTNPTTLQPTYSQYYAVVLYYHMLGYGNFDVGKVIIHVQDAVYLNVETADLEAI